MPLGAYLHDLERLKNPLKVKLLSGFFKTGLGEYGEGDIFLGITVPLQREAAKKHPDLTLDDIDKLLASPIHEHRLGALIILVEQYKKAGKKKDDEARRRISDDATRKHIFDFYLSHATRVNNWDLVDLSAPNIAGHYLLDKEDALSLLSRLAQSPNLWERRIAILATFEFIRNEKFDVSLKIATMLLDDKHDLIHKAVGWMLREVGKRNQAVEEEFLLKHYKKMPRTMLRYAIERFDEKKKKFYMAT